MRDGRSKDHANISHPHTDANPYADTDANPDAYAYAYAYAGPDSDSWLCPGELS